MELSEVATLQVALPVVAVVVLAVLVFAFGFKSPAQPPSFDYFDTDEKKHRKTRAKKVNTKPYITQYSSSWFGVPEPLLPGLTSFVKAKAKQHAV